MAEEVMHFFKKNVNYTVGVRLFRGDKDGVVLNSVRNVIEVEGKNLKEFKEANKEAILQGKIKEVEEPVFDWETANALGDEEIADLLKNFLKLKNAIATIDSLPILYKIRDAAAEKGVSRRTTSLISARIDELEPDEEVINREEMKGVV